MEGNPQSGPRQSIQDEGVARAAAGASGIPQLMMGEMSAAFVTPPPAPVVPAKGCGPDESHLGDEGLVVDGVGFEQSEMDADQNASIAETVQDSETIVQLDDGLLAAQIFITTPVGGGNPATLEGVNARLAEAGVVYGIDEEVLQEVVNEVLSLTIPGMRWGPILAAQGRAPVGGEDARIDYHPCLTATSGRPKVESDGTVNLFELNVVHNVTKGTVLAVETPPTPGQPGMTVMGAEIPARPGRECWLKPRKGTEQSEDKYTVTAAFDGHATLIQGEISVANVYHVNKDVGVETGNIQFVGSVVIRGNVQNGFTVKAEGDVEVQGGVDGGSIETSGNVTVQYGIKGALGRGKVVAGGAVKAKFIENADVRAGTNVWAADGILQSRVEAGATIEVLGRRGAIIGGRVSALVKVSARTLGSAMGSSTEISAGVTPAARTELGEIRKKQAEMEELVVRANQMIQFLVEQERRGTLGPQKRSNLSKLVATQGQLYNTMESLTLRAKELEQMFSESRTAVIEAREVCHPGVTALIGGARYAPSMPLTRAKFHLNDQQEIEVGKA